MRFEATVIEYSGIDDQYTNEDYDTFLFDLLKMFYFNNTTDRVLSIGHFDIKLHYVV